MSDNEELVLYATDGPVATITLNRPAAFNSFNKPLREALTAALRTAASDTNIRAVVLTGADGKFSAGADLGAGFPEDQTIQQQLQREYRPSFDEIVSMPKPVIAAIDGAAAGIALSYALVSDLAVMGEKSFLLAPFTTISLVPDGGATWLLQKQLGYKRALQLCLETERIDAARALEWGLVNRVVAPGEALANAQAWAAKLAELAPLSVQATKRSLRFAESSDWSSTFDYEAMEQQSLVGCADNQEGVSAFFEKRKPNFQGK